MVGQDRFLIPLGSDGARFLADEPRAIIAGDSGAYPPQNPCRIKLLEYADEITAWSRRPSFHFALSYDHIGDADATERDDERLHEALARRGATAGVVPVAHIGQRVTDMLGEPLADLDAQELAEAMEWGASFASGPVEHPAIAIGGIAAAKYAAHAVAWMRVFLDELERLSWHDPSIATVHLLGVGRVELAISSPLIESFDSSGPIRAAAYGWQNIAPNFTEFYGLPAAKLKASREARVAYFLCQLRDRAGLPWSKPDPEALLDDEPRRFYHGAGEEVSRVYQRQMALWCAKPDVYC